MKIFIELFVTYIQMSVDIVKNKIICAQPIEFIFKN
jgi:hypothetical protein